MKHRAALVSLLVAAHVGAAAGSPEFAEPPPPPPFNFSWEALARTDTDAEFDRLMERGRRAIFDSIDSMSSRAGADHAMEAADKFFGKAAELRPNDPMPHFYAAEALNAWDNVTYSFKNRIEQAIYHMSEFIRLAPSHSRVPEMLFSRSIAYTKLGGEENIRKALADYEERLLMEDQLSMAASDRYIVGLLLSNSAELYMYVGDIDRAIALYYDSLEYATSESAILYSYGLAVALDRDGQRARAADVMAETIRRDTSPFEQLTRESVFFIPEGDVHYYRALGYEVLGDNRKAVSYYTRFLDVLPKSPYAERAKENLAVLKRAPATGKGASPSADILGPMEP